MKAHTRDSPSPPPAKRTRGPPDGRLVHEILAILAADPDQELAAISSSETLAKLDARLKLWRKAVSRRCALQVVASSTDDPEQAR